MNLLLLVLKESLEVFIFTLYKITLCQQSFLTYFGIASNFGKKFPALIVFTFSLQLTGLATALKVLFDDDQAPSRYVSFAITV